MQGPVLSIFIGGGQEYYGDTAERDKQVVLLLPQLLSQASIVLGRPIQIVTGGTAGIPDDIATIVHCNGEMHVVDLVSSKYLPTYQKRTAGKSRPHWVIHGEQQDRRVALVANPDIAAALFIQGGPYSAHEIKLFQEAGRHVVTFYGSGGASGGKLDYNGFVYTKSMEEEERPYDSQDPDANPMEIAQALVQDLMKPFMI